MTAEDEEHLRLLSLFHYIAAGLVALCSLFPVIHLVIGILFVTGRMEAPPSGPGFPRGMETFGWIFIAIASTVIVLGLTMAACLFRSARCLKDRRSWTWCVVVAALSCLSVPFGTVLGVFTLIVLTRAPVKAAFDRPAGSPDGHSDRASLPL